MRIETYQPEYDDELTCRDCKGTGETEKDGDTIPCTACSGLGLITVRRNRQREDPYIDEER